MLKLRHEPYEILNNLPRTRFETELRDYVKKYFIREYRELGDSQTFEVCQLVIRNAAASGFRGQKEVFYYLSISCMLGCAFAKDPQLPWVYGLVKNLEVAPLTRIENLWTTVLAYSRDVAGEDNEILVAALQRARTAGLESLPDQSGSGLLTLLQRIYPEKYAYQGEANLNQVMKHAAKVAQTFHLDTGKGIALLTLLMFFLGSEVYQDPLYPWIKTTLSDSTYSKSEQKVQVLYGKAMQYVDIALQGRTEAGGPDE